MTKNEFFFCFDLLSGAIHLSTGARGRNRQNLITALVVGGDRRCDVISFSRPSRNERDFAGFCSVGVPLRRSSVCRRRIVGVETLSRSGQEHDGEGLHSLKKRVKDGGYYPLVGTIQPRREGQQR